MMICIYAQKNEGSQILTFFFLNSILKYYFSLFLPKLISSQIFCYKGAEFNSKAVRREQPRAALLRYALGVCREFRVLGFPKHTE